MIAAGKYVIPVKKISQRFTLYCIGDIHWGNAGCHLKTLRADVARAAADPDARVFLMGDLTDMIGPKDKRWDPATVTPDIPISAMQNWGQYLAQSIRDELAPLKGKIIGALYGNHENTYENRHAQQLHDWLCTELGCQNMGYSCFVDICFRKEHRGKRSGTCRSYRIFAHHGAGAAQSAGGKINRMVKFMNSNEADIYLVGHLHEKDPKRIDYLAANDTCTALVERRKLGVFTGSYLRTYHIGKRAGYGERAGYAPVPLGCSEVEFQPFASDWKQRENSVVARVVV